MRSFFLLLFAFCVQLLHAQSCEDAYGMYTDKDANLFFVSFNTVTNTQTKLHDFGNLNLHGNIYLAGIVTRQGFLNESLKTYYYFYAEPYYPLRTKLLCIDTETGDVKQTINLGMVYHLDYDLASGKFYGIRVALNGNVFYFSEFICVDPQTQAITSIANISPDTYFGSNTLVIDPVQRKYYIWTFKRTDLSTYFITTIFKGVLLTFDMNSGTQLSEVSNVEHFSQLLYHEKDSTFYGINFDTTGGFWYSRFDTVTQTPQHITLLSENQRPWYTNNMMINSDQNILMYYGSKNDPSDTLFERHYLFSLDLATGALVRTVNVIKGFPYNFGGMRLGNVWHSPVCKDITIPNLFTPNGDAKNDAFEIQNLLTGHATLQVYNAWGDLVYSNSAYANNWTAENNADGIYYYDLTTLSDQKKYQGWVQVLR